jgi:hypothetical protein
MLSDKQVNANYEKTEVKPKELSSFKIYLQIRIQSEDV